jgi:hypothetical protein
MAPGPVATTPLPVPLKGKTKTITLNLDELSQSDRRSVFAIAARAEKNRARIQRNREIIRRLKNSNDSLKKIAKDFGTTRQNISLIKIAAGINRARAPIPGRRRKSPI